MSMGAELEVREQAAFGALEAAANLPVGSITLVGLNLPAELTYEEWENTLRSLGHLHRWTPWAIADAFLWGLDFFGEDAVAAAVDGPIDRYNVIARLTGLHPDTVKNYVSLGSRIAKSRRRVELPPMTHEPVARLEPDEQTHWLQLAVDNAWTREELRTAINGPREGRVGGSLGRRDRVMVSLEQAVYQGKRVLGVAEPRDGGYWIPARVFEEFGAVLEGELD